MRAQITREGTEEGSYENMIEFHPKKNGGPLESEIIRFELLKTLYLHLETLTWEYTPNSLTINCSLST